MSLFNKMRDNDPTGKDIFKEESFATASNARNLTFILANGRAQFLNYAYLVMGDYLADENTIILTYTSHIVTLKGTTLEPLFIDLASNIPRILVCDDERYNAITDENQKYCVTEISITANQ